MMTANVMRRAWEIAREAANRFGGTAREYILGGAVKMAWDEAKGMNKEDKIAKLEQLGFRRWTKAGYDRLYINAGVLGLNCTYRRTGSISNAWFNGKMISNSEAGRMKASKTYIGIKTWTLYSDDCLLRGAATELMNTVA